MFTLQIYVVNDLVYFMGKTVLFIMFLWNVFSVKLRRGVRGSESKIFRIAKIENIRPCIVWTQLFCHPCLSFKVSKPRSALCGVNSPVLPGGWTEAGQKGWHMACQCRLLLNAFSLCWKQYRKRYSAGSERFSSQLPTMLTVIFKKNHPEINNNLAFWFVDWQKNRTENNNLPARHPKC